MIKKYKMTRVVRNVEAMQLKESNIIDVAIFLNTSDFESIVYNENDVNFKLKGISFYNVQDDTRINVMFKEYIVKLDGRIEVYPELDFNLLFEEEK